MKSLSHGPDGPDHSVKNQKPHKIRAFRLIQGIKTPDFLCQFYSMELRNEIKNEMNKTN